MKRNSENKSHWNDVHGTAKIRYLFDYYKFPLVLIGIVIYIMIWGIGRNASRKEYGLYVGLVNLAASQELTGKLENGIRNHLLSNKLCLYLKSPLKLLREQ